MQRAAFSIVGRQLRADEVDFHCDCANVGSVTCVQQRLRFQKICRISWGNFHYTARNGISAAHSRVGEDAVDIIGDL